MGEGRRRGKMGDRGGRAWVNYSYVDRQRGPKVLPELLCPCPALTATPSGSRLLHSSTPTSACSLVSIPGLHASLCKLPQPPAKALPLPQSSGYYQSYSFPRASQSTEDLPCSRLSQQQWSGQTQPRSPWSVDNRKVLYGPFTGTSWSM